MARIRTVSYLPAVLLLAVGLSACGPEKKASSSMLLEDHFTYAISHFAIPNNMDDRLEGMRQVLQAIQELESGMPFDEVARRRTPKDGNAPPGGWLGFMRPEQPEPMTGAFQAVRPGNYGGPFEQNQATHFIFRHTFEEGREIESRTVIPVYGFIVPNDPKQMDPSMRDIAQRAKGVWEQVNRGEMTLQAASELLGSSVNRSDAFFGNVRNLGPQKELYGITEKVEPGELAPLTPIPGALVFAKRGVYFRSHVRHVLIQHLESLNRPLTVSRPKDEAKALAEKVLAELRDGTLTWEEAVRRHSDEVSTLALNGWIGAVTNGDLIPEFEAAVVATEPGELVAEVLESGDGFHVINRVN